MEPGTVARLETGEEAHVHVVRARATDRTDVRHAVLQLEGSGTVVVDRRSARAIHALDGEQELVPTGVLAEAGDVDVVILTLLYVEGDLTHEALRTAVIVSTEALEVVEVAIHGLEHEDLGVEERVAGRVESVGATGAHDHLLVGLGIEDIPDASRIDVLTGAGRAHKILAVDRVGQRTGNLGATLNGLGTVGVVVGRRALAGAVVVCGARVVVEAEGIRATKEGAGTGLAKVDAVAAHLIRAGAVEVARHILEVPSDVVGVVAGGDVEEVASRVETNEVGAGRQVVALVGLVQRARGGDVAVQLGDVVHRAVPAVAKGVRHADLQDELACRAVDARPVVDGRGRREVRGVEVRTAVTGEVAEAAVEHRVGTEVARRRVRAAHRAIHVTERDAVGTADLLVAELGLVEGARVDHGAVVGREGVDAVVPAVLEAVEHLKVVAALGQTDRVGAGSTEVDHRVGLHVADVPADLAVPASAADLEEEEVLLVAAGAVVVDGGGVVVHGPALGASVAAVVAVPVGNGRRLVIVAGRRVRTALAADVFAAPVVEVGRRVVVAGAFRGAPLIETGRIPHEEELLDGTTRHAGATLQNHLAVPDDFPGRLHGEVVEVQLEHIAIVHETEVEVDGRSVREFDAAHFHAGQVADRGRTNVPLSIHPAIGEGVIQADGHAGVVAAGTVVEAGLRVIVAGRLVHTAGNAVELRQGEVEGRGRPGGQFPRTRPATDEGQVGRVDLEADAAIGAGVEQDDRIGVLTVIGQVDGVALVESVGAPQSPLADVHDLALRQARYGHTVLGGVEVRIQGDGLRLGLQGEGEGDKQNPPRLQRTARKAELHGSAFANSVVTRLKGIGRHFTPVGHPERYGENRPAPNSAKGSNARRIVRFCRPRTKNTIRFCPRPS